MELDEIFELIRHRIQHNEKLTPKMQDILHASLVLFSEKGYSNTSTKDIARLAQVAEGTLFKHFGSKENLLYASLLPILGSSLEQALPAAILQDEAKLAALSFADFLRLVLPERIDFANNSMKIWKIFMTEYLYQEELRANLLSLLPVESLRKIHTLLDNFKNKGDILDWPNEEIIRLILSTVAGYVIACSMQLASANDTKKDIGHLIRFLEKGLRPD